MFGTLVLPVYINVQRIKFSRQNIVENILAVMPCFILPKYKSFWYFLFLYLIIIFSLMAF